MQRIKNLSKLFVFCAVLALNVSYANAGIFFQDNFDNLSSTWNIGLGPSALVTPSGQEGHWNVGVGTGSIVESACSSATAATLKALYPWTYVSGVYYSQTGPGTAPVFINPTADRNGGKAIQTARINACDNGFPGSIEYDFTTNRKDIYISMWIKYESGYNKSSFVAGCKVPFYIHTTGNPIYIQYAGNGSGAFGNSNIQIYDSADLNSYSWWNTGITPAMLYNDHAWHQIQFHLKMNSSAAVSDGSMTAWIDGNQTGTISGQRYYNSGTRYFTDISIEQGNCSDEPWSQTSWKSVWFDDFKLSDTYIPYDGSGGGSDTTPPSVSLTSPTSNSTYSTSSSSVAVSGTASDNISLSSIKWACPTCTPTSGTAIGTSSWSVSSIGLTSGSNAITVTSTDSSNNTSTDTLTVTSTTSGINGACGTASGQSYSSLTSSSSNLCATGTAASFTGTGPWTWGCNGSGGGTNTANNACSASLTTANLLFSEDFEDSNYLNRGWYDGTHFDLVSSEHENGAQSARFAFAQGATSWTGTTGAMRKLFTSSDAVYVDYYIKYSAGWREQTGGFGHHEIHVATDADNDYTNLAFTHTLGYIEHWGTSGSSTPLSPHLTLQDGANIDQSKINVNLTASTENRSTNGCNGLLDSTFFDSVSCYDSGGGEYWNGKTKGASSQTMSLNAWHHVQAYFKMNTITANKGNADGTLAYWLDGVQQFRSDAVLFRTNQHSTMKFNQFVIAPYMGNGAPVTQTFYIDNLKVFSGIPSSSSGPGSTTLTIQSVTNP